MSQIGMKSRFGTALTAVVFLLAAAASARESRGVGYSGALPYRGDSEAAMADPSAGKTIPLAKIKRLASKDGRLYTDNIVGGRPFAAQKATTTIDVLIVPLIVQLGGTTFDPTQADPRITGGATPRRWAPAASSR